MLASTAVAPPELPVTWPLEQLQQAPAVRLAPSFGQPGLRALYYEGLPFQQRPTRVFAWIGLPNVPPGENAPGMVLVHGGMGTAYPNWVRWWTSRGYAAIAMDLNGCVPVGQNGQWQRHEWAGPLGISNGGQGGISEMDRPLGDQWPYHAVAAVIRANSLLRSLPQVDAERIGITGISWGGWLTCIVAGVDGRFKLAVPVYGCGFIHEESAFRPLIEQAPAWVKLWEPSRYLMHCRVPMLWVSSPTDFAYPLDSVQKSYRVAPGPHHLSIRVGMPHGHGDSSEKTAEIAAFADAILKGGQPLPRITSVAPGIVTFSSATRIVSATLNFTTSAGPWDKRQWQTIPAKLDPTAGTVTAAIPPATRQYYFNLTDERGLVVSSEHVTVHE